jgi:SIR2-like domain
MMPNESTVHSGQPGSTAALKSLTDRVKAGQCILFLGAGVHSSPPADSGYTYPEEYRLPLGGNLSELLAGTCDFAKELPDESLRDLQRVSLYIETTRGLGRKALVDLLYAQLTSGRKPSPALNMLAELPFKIIVTTNYDHLLESALHNFEKDPLLIVYNPDTNEPTPDPPEDPTPERPLVFKMHGDLDKRASIVITDEDYITFVQRMSDKEALHPVPQTVRYRMKQWPTLFVGYSLRDYNLRLLFRTLRWRIDTSDIPPSFSVDQDPDPLVVKVLQDNLKFVTFVARDIWSFVPWLYREVTGKDYPS